MPRVTRGLLLGLACLVATACGSTATSPSDSAEESASATAAQSPPSGDGSAAMEPGVLQSGVRYASEGLGLSLQPPDGDWFATVDQDLEFDVGTRDVTVYFTRPSSLRPTGEATSTQAAPATSEAFLEAIESHPAVTVVGSEPLSIGGLEGLMVDIESSGMTEQSAIVLTAGGQAFGFPDGEGRLLLVDTADGVVMISIEGGASRDEAWEIVGPLLQTLEEAP